jgi:hypothetical protein
MARCGRAHSPQLVAGATQSGFPRRTLLGKRRSKSVTAYRVHLLRSLSTPFYFRHAQYAGYIQHGLQVYQGLAEPVGRVAPRPALSLDYISRSKYAVTDFNIPRGPNSIRRKPLAARTRMAL